jgi:hypothetical protein
MVTEESPSTTIRDRPGGARDEAGLGAHGLPLQWRWLVPLAALASTGAWLTGVVSGGVEGRSRIALIAMGATCALLAAGVPLWQQARAARARADAVEAARSARAAMRIAMEDALDPFAALLRQLATAKGRERARLRGEAIQLSLTSMAQLSAMADPTGDDRPRRVRVCYFALQPGPPRRLVPQTYAGRAGTPTITFDETTPAGRFLLGVADSGWVVVDDTGEQPIWWDEERAHRTFVAGPVPGNGQAAGVVTLDALEPGEFADLDLPLVRLLAHLLSLAMRM